MRVPVALQLWTVREEARRDFPSAVKTVSSLGYEGVEHVHSLGYGGKSPRDAAEFVGECGLRPAGCHFELVEWEADVDAMVACALELGVQYPAVSWLEPERRSSESSYGETAASIRRIAENVSSAGMKLVYHHHDFELQRFNGVTALEILRDAVGEELLLLELDVHWLKRAGEDPADYLERTGSGCPLVHFKDLNPGGMGITDHKDPLPFTEVGSGCIDFSAIARAAVGAEWLIVEQDFCSGSSFESARQSLEHLRQIGIV